MCVCVCAEADKILVVAKINLSQLNGDRATGICMKIF